ncbi:MAG: hypothetical protein COW90_03780, partial [Nitrospirae bacterium CG22_combo_CG10-13_8_21_14_all_44_11]
MQQNQEKLKTKKVMETENKESMRPRINPILAIASFVVLSIFLVKSADFDAFWIIILFLVGCITGIIADNKGRDFWGWWFFGILFFILALPLVLVLKPDEKALVEK